MSRLQPRSPRLCTIALCCGAMAACAPPAPADLASTPLSDVTHAFVQEDGAPLPDTVALRVHASRLTLRREALGKTFTLSPMIVVSSPTPMVDLMGVKLVQFEARHDAVALFDMSPAVYGGLPAHKLLQTFVVTGQDAQSVTFAWNYGLRTWSWSPGYATSTQEHDREHEQQARALPVEDVFVESLTVVGDSLELRQVATVRPQPDTVKTVHATFRLEPERPASTFVPRLSTRQHGVGFFEVSGPRQGDGGQDLFAMRWDLSPSEPPITYSLTRDVPAEFAEAVADGVLYWNAVAGREIVRVERDVAPDVLPKRRQVIVRWAPFRQAGFARAALQAHPVTGEILAADVHLTSFWGYWGARSLRRALQMPPGDDPMVAGPEHFSSASVCHREADTVSTARLALQAGTSDPARISAAAGDFVRLVAAHEVGHSLGLRHNFAASMEGELDDRQALHAAWQAYLHDLEHGGAMTASSVMDYSSDLDSFLLGAYVRQHVLPYDRAALEWAYGETYRDARAVRAPLFCTDDEAATVLGCAPHDSGSNPVAGALGDLVMARQQLSGTLLQTLADGMQPDYPGDVAPDDVALRLADPDAQALQVTSRSFQLLEGVAGAAETLPVKRAAGVERWLDRDHYRQRNIQQLQAWLADVEGLPGYLAHGFGLVDRGGLTRGWLAAEVRARLDAPGFGTGVTSSGVPYTLPPAAVSAIRDYAPRLADQLEQSLLRDLLGAVTGEAPGLLQRAAPQALLAALSGRRYEASLVDPAWQEPLGSLAEGIVLGTDAELAGRIGQRDVRVERPSYREDVRLAAVRLLSPQTFCQPDWLQGRRHRVIDTLRSRLLLVARPGGVDSGGDGPTLVVPAEVSMELKRWAAAELKVLQALNTVTLSDSMRALLQHD